MARTVAGAVNLFRSAAHEPSIKSVVYTSDSYGVLLPEENKKITLTTSDYNEYAIRAAHDPAELKRVKTQAWDPSVAVEFVIWAAAKASAEKAVWQFVSDHQQSFQVSSVIPNMNFGGPIGSLPLSSTGKSLPDLLLNKPHPDLYFPAQHFVNVRDCAKLHVAALLDPTSADQRLFAFAAPFNWNDALQVLRELRPNMSIRRDFHDLGTDQSILPNAAAEQLLRKWYGHGWSSLKETVMQNIDGL